MWVKGAPKQDVLVEQGSRSHGVEGGGAGPGQHGKPRGRPSSSTQRRQQFGAGKEERSPTGRAGRVGLAKAGASFPPANGLLFCHLLSRTAGKTGPGTQGRRKARSNGGEEEHRQARAACVGKWTTTCGPPANLPGPWEAAPASRQDSGDIKTAPGAVADGRPRARRRPRPPEPSGGARRVAQARSRKNLAQAQGGRAKSKKKKGPWARCSASASFLPENSRPQP